MLRSAAFRLNAGSGSSATLAQRSSRRALATVAPVSAGSGVSAHRILIVGGGAAGQAVSHQLLRSGRFDESDIAIVDPASWHHYQPGWTLVGGGLNAKEDFRKPMREVVESGVGEGQLKLYEDAVTEFAPEKDQVRTRDGRTIHYEHLVVAPGLELNFGGVAGLEEALLDEGSGVSSIYSYDTCSRLYPQIEALSKGKAIFTQPAGVVKCAGAPQKVMWMAVDHWKRLGQFVPQSGASAASGVEVTFATGMPSMFAVPKYSAILNELRSERGVEGLFEHNLVSLSGRTATFARPGGEKVELPFDLLHVTPPMRAPKFVRESVLADKATGFVEVDRGTTRHKRFSNIWSLGDASSLPTSKTVAAITGEAPVLSNNLLSVLAGGEPTLEYDGYTSCPLITEYGKVLLAEFVYDAKPSETFTPYGLSQDTPRRAFWHLKKDLFPWVYYSSHVQGTWGGRNGYLSAPSGGRSFSTSRTARPQPPSASARRAFSTSAPNARNLPARRPRDPLLAPSSGARRSLLPSGETFFVRPPSSAGSADATPEAPSPLLGGGLPSRRLPPPLHARDSPSATAPPRLSPAQIAEMRSLRAEGYTAAELARRFGCSPLFVSISAPAPPQRVVEHEQRLKEEEQRKLNWGERKRTSRFARAVRREAW